MGLFHIPPAELQGRKQNVGMEGVSNDKTASVFVYWVPSLGHVFHTAQETMIKSYNTSHRQGQPLQFHAKNPCSHAIIKSPRYTGGDFMFLYRFVRRRRLQILVHAITFEQLFGFL